MPKGSGNLSYPKAKSNSADPYHMHEQNNILNSKQQQDRKAAVPTLGQWYLSGAFDLGTAVMAKLGIKAHNVTGINKQVQVDPNNHKADMQSHRANTSDQVTRGDKKNKENTQKSSKSNKSDRKTFDNNIYSPHQLKKAKSQAV